MDVWLVVSTPLKKKEFVSWDDYPIYGQNKIHVPNHQPAQFVVFADPSCHHTTNTIHQYLTSNELKIAQRALAWAGPFEMPRKFCFINNFGPDFDDKSRFE